MNCRAKVVITSAPVLPNAILKRILISRLQSCRKLLGILLLVYCTDLSAPTLLLSQEVRTGSAQKVGVIKTSELSKLVLDRMAELKKFEAAGMTVPPQSFILVDVRSDRERSISVIPGAISQAEFEKNQKTYSGKVVIPYCTIGGRCGDFSRRLAQAGWTVRSYRGSIVEWVQNELPLVTPQGEVTTMFHSNGGSFRIPPKYRTVSN